jgi:hypothetical protein
MQMTSHKITISRGAESTHPAISKHFLDLISRYNNVKIVNLLGQKDSSGEFVLTDAFKSAVGKLSELQELNGTLFYTGFDYHSIVKRDNYERLDDLLGMINEDMDSFSFFTLDKITNGYTVQKGVFRTNCLDCLDRTNVVQTCIARAALCKFLRLYDYHTLLYDESGFWSSINNLWADNGDWLSKIYSNFYSFLY